MLLTILMFNSSLVCRFLRYQIFCFPFALRISCVDTQMFCFLFPPVSSFLIFNLTQSIFCTNRVYSQRVSSTLAVPIFYVPLLQSSAPRRDLPTLKSRLMSQGLSEGGLLSRETLIAPLRLLAGVPLTISDVRATIVCHSSNRCCNTFCCL